MDRWEYKMSIITDYFEMEHNENVPDAKFKIGEEVVYNSLLENFKGFWGKKFIITGVSWQDNDKYGNKIFEYSLSGFPYLVYENELEKIKDATYCKKCGAPKETFKCNYCGV
jgi:hypothetical protein